MDEIVFKDKKTGKEKMRLSGDKLELKDKKEKDKEEEQEEDESNKG